VDKNRDGKTEETGHSPRNIEKCSVRLQFPPSFQGEVDSAEATLSALSIMARTTTYTDQQLLDFSREHLLYELNIFQWLIDAIPKTQKSFQLSAYLESFTVHLRALIDFLYEQPRWDGDVVADDFFDSPGSWTPGAVPKILDDARTRMNKEVGHITIDRKTGMDPTKPWEVDKLFGEILPVLKTFATGASPKKLHADVVAWAKSDSAKMLVMAVNASTTTTNTSSSIISSAFPPTKKVI
jgi:hypothetical protein